MSESLEELAARMSPPTHIVFIEDDQVVYRSDDHLTITLVGSMGGETFRAVLVRPEDRPWTDEDCHNAFDMVLEAAKQRREWRGLVEGPGNSRLIWVVGLITIWVWLGEKTIEWLEDHVDRIDRLPFLFPILTMLVWIVFRPQDIPGIIKNMPRAWRARKVGK